MSGQGDLIKSVLERARAAIEHDLYEQAARRNTEAHMNNTPEELLATLNKHRDLRHALQTLSTYGPMSASAWCFGRGHATEARRQWLRKHGLVKWDKSARKWKTTRAGECALFEVEGWRP